MNQSKAIELGICAALRCRDIGEATQLRAWQTLVGDGAYHYDEKRGTDILAPIVDVRAGAPYPADNGVTRLIDVQVVILTQVDDDRDHAQISRIYEGVQEAIDELVDNFCRDNDNEVVKAFLAALEDTKAESKIGGIILDQGQPPMSDDSFHSIGLALQINIGK